MTPSLPRTGVPSQPRRELMTSLLESQVDLVIFALDRDYRYVAFNEIHRTTMRKIWGVNIELGQSMLDAIGREDDRQKAQANFDRALAGESFMLTEAFGDIELSRRYYEDSYSPLRNEDGAVTGLTVFLKDVTEQRKIRKELDQYRADLEQRVADRTAELEEVNQALREEMVERSKLEAQVHHTQKLESLGVLAGGIAHDFNNLLMGIQGNAELALMSCDSEGAAKDHLEQVRQITGRAAELTSQMLAYSGRGPFIQRSVDVAELIRDMQPLLQMSTYRQVQLELEVEDAPVVRGDVSQLRQVVLNLVSNAAEACRDMEGRVNVVTGASEDHATITVRDNGSGIDQDTRERMFDPFFTTKIAGRGLGLAVVQGIVHGHGGWLEVESDPDVGTTITAFLPLSKNVAEPLNRWVDAADSGWRGSGLALLADDDPDVRRAVASMLAQRGLEVVEAANGAECIDRFEEHRDRVTVLLLDYTMPGMNGREVIEQLHERGVSAPILVLSGYTAQDTSDQLAGLPMSSFLQKPFTERQLATVLQRLLQT